MSAQRSPALAFRLGEKDLGTAAAGGTLPRPLETTARAVELEAGPTAFEVRLSPGDPAAPSGIDALILEPER